MEKDTHKKLISKNEYLQLVGLVSVASKHYRAIHDCEEVIKEILDYESKWDSGVGHFSDEIFSDNPSVDNALKNMGVKVSKQKKKSSKPI